MGKRSHRKGGDFERAVAKALGGHRVPLSGAVVGFPGDVVAEINGKRWRIECKKRANGFKQHYRWLSGNDALVTAADRCEPLITLRLSDFIALTHVEASEG